MGTGILATREGFPRGPGSGRRWLMSTGCIALLGAPLSPPPRREAAARPRPTFPARPFFRRLRPQGRVLPDLAGIPAGPARGAAPGGARLPVSQVSPARPPPRVCAPEVFFWSGARATHPSIRCLENPHGQRSPPERLTLCGARPVGPAARAPARTRAPCVLAAGRAPPWSPAAASSLPSGLLSTGPWFPPAVLSLLQKPRSPKSTVHHPGSAGVSCLPGPPVRVGRAVCGQALRLVPTRPLHCAPHSSPRRSGPPPRRHQQPPHWPQGGLPSPADRQQADAAACCPFTPDRALAVPSKRLRPQPHPCAALRPPLGLGAAPAS